MKFISLLFNLKLLYNFFLFLALINIFFSTGKSHAKTFAINDIQISKPFEINFNKNEIIDEGFVEAFNELILSIVQSKDQVKLTNLSAASILTPLFLYVNFFLFINMFYEIYFSFFQFKAFI